MQDQEARQEIELMKGELDRLRSEVLFLESSITAAGDTADQAWDWIGDYNVNSYLVGGSKRIWLQPTGDSAIIDAWKGYDSTFELYEFVPTSFKVRDSGGSDEVVRVNGTKVAVSAGTGVTGSGPWTYAGADPPTDDTYVYLKVVRADSTTTIEVGTSLPDNDDTNAYLPLWKIPVAASAFVFSEIEDMRNSLDFSEDVKVAVDADAAAGFVGANYNDGVFRWADTSSPAYGTEAAMSGAGGGLYIADGGDFLTWSHRDTSSQSDIDISSENPAREIVGLTFDDAGHVVQVSTREKSYVGTDWDGEAIDGEDIAMTHTQLSDMPDAGGENQDHDDSYFRAFTTSADAAYWNSGSYYTNANVAANKFQLTDGDSALDANNFWDASSAKIDVGGSLTLEFEDDSTWTIGGTLTVAGGPNSLVETWRNAQITTDADGNGVFSIGDGAKYYAALNVYANYVQMGPSTAFLLLTAANDGQVTLSGDDRVTITSTGENINLDPFDELRINDTPGVTVSSWFTKGILTGSATEKSVGDLSPTDKVLVI